MTGAPPSDQLASAARVRIVESVTAESFVSDIEALQEPVVLRQLVDRWPAVAAGRKSSQALAEYLSSGDNGARVRAFVGEENAGGRYFYRPDVEGFNFGVAETTLSKLLSTLADPSQAGRSIYMGSTATAAILPYFAAANRLELATSRGAEPRIWIGNSSRIAPHFDESDNIACVVSGRRRFVLFPVEQVANLYVGPIDRTVAGQPISMVDIDDPDFDRHPKFREALSHALVAELEPGDAIYIPALWWHAVRATGDLNVLVNYWWNESPPDAGSPMHALGHGLLTISHLPAHKRERWRTLFDHYVFQRHGYPADHIPEPARGILARTSPQLRRTIRQFLLRALSSL